MVLNSLSTKRLLILWRVHAKSDQVVEYVQASILRRTCDEFLNLCTACFINGQAESIRDIRRHRVDDGKRAMNPVLEPSAQA